MINPVVQAHLDAEQNQALSDGALRDLGPESIEYFGVYPHDQPPYYPYGIDASPGFADWSHAPNPADVRYPLSAMGSVGFETSQHAPHSVRGSPAPVIFKKRGCTEHQTIWWIGAGLLVLFLVLSLSKKR